MSDGKWPRRLTSPNGKLAFNLIDGPDDEWFWAIFDAKADDAVQPVPCGAEILLGFKDSYEPDEEQVTAILRTLEQLI